jgi:hypothetical protein
MAKHWSEELGCRCGARFRSYEAEARHRHNFPALCKRPKPKKARTRREPDPLKKIIVQMDK